MHIAEGIVTLSCGSSHFKIAPYPILIIGVMTFGRKVQMFDVYTGFAEVAEGFEVDEKTYCQLTPNSVQINELLQKLLDDMGVVLSNYSEQNQVNIVRRSKEDGMKSECPSFEKHWDAEVVECKECGKHFPDEYSACKKRCLEKQASKNPPAVKTPPKDEKPETPVSEPVVEPKVETTAPVVEPVPPKETPKSKDVFKGFRAGTRADVLITYLEEAGRANWSELTDFVASECDIDPKKALDNIKGYVSEWKKGMWSGAEKNFPFVITVDGDEVIYTKKESDG